MSKQLIALITAMIVPLTSHAAAATQKMCVFDLLGTSGEGFGMAKDYALVMMQKTGANITLKVYVDERIAIEDFKTGQCDAVSATGLRTHAFNPLSASIDAIGATTLVRGGKVDSKGSYQLVRNVIGTFSSPAAAKLMVNGEFEVGGITPLGPAYPFVNDRKINSVEAVSGKRIAALDYDKAQAAMIQRIGGQAVSADITNISSKFNNGLVDVIVMPAAAYKPLELYKGMGSKGAISRMPLVMLSYQMIFRRGQFPEGYGQTSRDYWLAQFDTAQSIIMRMERDVPESIWMELKGDDAGRYSQMMREARIDMAKEGFYDKKGLKIIKKIRCNLTPQEAECSDEAETNW